MNQILKKFLFSIVIILSFSFNSTGSENKILIKVNNEIITSYDLLVEINYLSVINDNFKNLDINQSIEIARNSLIKEKIKEIELKKILGEIKIDDNQLNDIIKSYFKKFGIKTISNFNNYFLSREINPEIVKKKISLEVIWNQYIYAKYNNKVKIDKNKIKKEIQENNKQKEYLLSEILFSLENNESIENKLKKINKKILEKGFSEAALTYSVSDTSKNGGKLGWVKNSVLSDQIRKNLENLEIGNYTNPIVLPGGILILKIENAKEVEKQINIDEELEFIVKKKTQQQLNQFSNIYLKKIKKDIKINEL